VPAPGAGPVPATLLAGGATDTAGSAAAPIGALPADPIRIHPAGASLVLVAVGSGPGLAAGAFWHVLTYALVKAEPG
jgi:hypothetical protein